jgi:hypothetical protein
MKKVFRISPIELPKSFCLIRISDIKNPLITKKRLTPKKPKSIRVKLKSGNT